MRTIFYILMFMTIYSCKKYNCECTTIELVHINADPPIYTNYQEVGITKSQAKSKCAKHEHYGADGKLTTCEIK